jgi:hypothetical protein
VAREIEFANNFRTKERNHVGAFREKEAGNDFFGDGGAAENPTALQDQNFFAGFGQIGRVDETVVTAADDDNVVGLRHSFKTPR